MEAGVMIIFHSFVLLSMAAVAVEEVDGAGFPLTRGQSKFYEFGVHPVQKVKMTHLLCFIYY